MADVDPERPWDRELTPAELEESRASWPGLSEAKQKAYMKARLRANFLKTQPHPDDPTRRRLGGHQPAVSEKHKRVAEYIVEQAEEHRKKIWDAFESGLDAKDDPRIRVKAASELVKITQTEEAISIRREEIARELDKQPLEEVKRMLAEGLAKAIERGDVDPSDIASLFGVKQKAIDGTATELDAAA